jgi:hypothetical protein
MIAKQVGDSRLGIMRCALTGATVLAVLFALCWLLAVFNVAGASHMYMGLFMAGPSGPIGTLLFGVICSGVAGLLTGALVAVSYNLFAFVDRR